MRPGTARQLVHDGMCHGREWDRQHESAVPPETLGVNAPCKLVKQFVE